MSGGQPERKLVYSSLDAQPIVVYALRDANNPSAYPVLVTEDGNLLSGMLGFNGTNWHPVRADGATRSLQTIDYQHHEIHAGSNFFIDDVADLSTNNVLDLQFTTPNTEKWSHWTFQIQAGSELRWWIYEGATVVTVGTTVFTPRNSDRNSASTSGNLVLGIANVSEATANTYTTTVGSIRLAVGVIGEGKDGGLVDRVNEKILKQNTTYLLRGKAIAAGYTSFMMHWYEHTNKVT